ncbi:hypothetical protein G9F73_004310 [Clostridium estertheticum]|uniref:hypothetical protein n=1 Tax=Clostridium estertheticum TaxID=238834 RepID=UPI0013EEC6F6|nr:hypothetical protein [Clostridium estertheticum]MBZ9607054.1 hypothetical protein [Clostridium estertheticum]
MIESITSTCFVFGRRSTGYFDIRLLDGTSIYKSAKFSELKLLQRSKSLLIENRKEVKQG